MNRITPWACSHFRLPGAVGIFVLLMLPLLCAAQEPGPGNRTVEMAVSPQTNNNIPLQANTTARQLEEMQAKMDTMQRDYNARLLQMQTTIDMLTARVNKSGKQASAEPSASGPQQSAPPGDQDIGQALIFEPDEKAGKTPLTAPDQTLSNFGIGGRAPLDATLQAFNTGNTSLGQSFNPDIVVAGDFVGHYTSRRNAGELNRIGLREAEFGFSGAIDPYAKGTFIFSKPENGPLEVEEGYVTFVALPFGLQAKLGKMRSPFGKINVLHGHDLPQTDRPDVYTNFFGEDGLIESGVALSKLLPLPWYSSVDVQVADGDTVPLFGHSTITKPLTVGRWKNFFELTDTQSIEVGASGAIGARGRMDNMAPLTGVEGIDFTYHWIPPAQRHAFVWQTEVLAAQREHPFDAGKNSIWGGYSFVEYKMSPRWNVGIRLDYSQTPLIANAQTWAIAPYVNFLESEFGRLRLEYKHTFGDSHIQSSDQVWAQYTMILGLHPPHTF